MLTPEQKATWRTVFHPSMTNDDFDYVCMLISGTNQTICELKEAKTALEAAQADQARYLFLRNSYYGPGLGAANRALARTNTAEELDAAIDAALAAKA